MKESPLFSIEQPNITIIPAIQKCDSKTPDTFMAILWNPGGHSMNTRKNKTIGYIKELEYIEKSQTD